MPRIDFLSVFSVVVADFPYLTDFVIKCHHLFVSTKKLSSPAEQSYLSLCLRELMMCLMLSLAL